jgi:hypothetical protein
MRQISFEEGMQRRHARVGLCAVLMCAVTTTAVAQSARFEEEFDDADKPWQEIAVQLPLAPLPENLVSLPQDSSASQSFAIDSKSMSLGSDGVIRYTLVGTSNAGARNVSYEGIRCATHERKLYAFGQPDGSWSRSRRDQWERIVSSGTNRQHAVLAREFFCQELTIAGTPEQMLERLRRNRPLSPQNYR